MSKRPLIETTIRTEFGDVLESPEFYEVGGADRDLTHVPGFSEMRRERDKEIAAVAQGRKDKRDANIQPLPVNMRWVRATDVRGAPDARKEIGAGNLGYRIVNKDEAGKHAWFTKLPAGAVVGADGSIRKGDTVLMVADGKTAARNAARKAAYTDSMSRTVAAAKGGLLDSTVRAVEPFVEQEKAAVAAK